MLHGAGGSVGVPARFDMTVAVRRSSEGHRMSSEDRLEQARLLYERAVFGGDASAVTAADRELDAVEADLALARGRILHARFLDHRTGEQAKGDVVDELALFERAADLYRTLGDQRGEAEALFWIGTFHQVVQHDNGAAVPVLERSRELATSAGDLMTTSYVLRHLGIAEHSAGHLAAARDLLEQSTHIRRKLGFLPGVAANLVGLAYIAAGDGRPADAESLLDEAGSTANDSGAAGIWRQVAEARTQLSG